MADVAVLGAGNWGTTLAQVIADNGYEVSLWARRKALVTHINKHHENKRYLAGIPLNPGITATTDIAQCVDAVPVVLFVVPSKAFREVAREVGDTLQPDQVVLHATKEIEPGSQKRMSQLLMEETCALQIGVASGPNIAREICEGKPAGIVVATAFPRVFRAARKLLHCPRLRVYDNDDVVGVELAGALKNVVAIAGGMATAMGLGENAKALLMTRGLSEVARIGVAMGARPTTFSGVAGIGDLIVTCTSTQSRNHRVGAALAEGKTLKQAVKALGMVAEGVRTAAVVRDISERRGIEAPLLVGVHRVLDGELSPQQALQHLMGLDAMPDVAPALR